jgi:tRNA A37 N6-isopentenylltransferase MiaA
MQKEYDYKLLIIYGPTATDKTALALQLARKFQGELISTDY